MRQYHSTITPAVVTTHARQSLREVLPYKPYGKRVTQKLLLDVILLAAALGSSLSAIVKRFAFGFSHETARKALDTNLPDLDSLTRGLVDALHRFFSARLLRRHSFVVAIDEHRCPFYGNRDTTGVTGGQKKHGSKYAYSYATAVLVHRGRRYTVGLLPLVTSLKPHQIVAVLLDQLEERGLKVRGVVLDSAFDSGETLLRLQARNLSYTVPLRRKGRGGNRRNDLWDAPAGTVATVEWSTESNGKHVSTQTVVIQRPQEKEKKVYAFGGWTERKGRSEMERARLAKRWYRKRFGIETSYRQMNECKAKTTKKDVRYRLLLIGVALLLRQVWVWFTGQLSRDRGLRPTQWVEYQRLSQMIEWLADFLKGRHKEKMAIPLGSPLAPF